MALHSVVWYLGTPAVGFVDGDGGEAVDDEEGGGQGGERKEDDRPGDVGEDVDVGEEVDGPARRGLHQEGHVIVIDCWNQKYV